jgi:hypothetical protein
MLQTPDAHRQQAFQFAQFVANEYDEVNHRFEKVVFLRHLQIHHTAHL